MNSRQRLEATITGKPVDRIAVNFYEIGGFNIDRTNPDPFNVYNAPTWQPLIDLAENETDLLRMRGPAMCPATGNRRGEFFDVQTSIEGESALSERQRYALRVAR